MDDSRILIVGAGGQLGRALVARFPKAVAVDRDTFDMSDWGMLSAYDWSGVDVIINAAAYTAVDQAETPEGRIDAWKTNATAVGYLSRIASEQQKTLVHISTDYVFDGTKRPHTEDEPFAPLSVYGQSKAAGDIAASATSKHYILRTSWVIGDGKNFVQIMMGLAEKNISPTVVNDQIGRLTFTATLVEAIAHLLETKAQPGTYNITNNGDPVSWADIASVIFKKIEREDLHVTPVTTDTYYADKPGIAPRPLQSTLSLDKIKATGLQLRDWRDDLETYIANAR